MIDDIKLIHRKIKVFRFALDVCRRRARVAGKQEQEAIFMAVLKQMDKMFNGKGAK